MNWKWLVSGYLSLILILELIQTAWGDKISFWEQYRSHTVAFIIVVAIQSLLIGILLLERSRRQRATYDLRKSEELFRLLFENSKDAILISNDHGNYLQVNQAACELLGYTREQLQEMNNTELLSSYAPLTAIRFQGYLESGFEAGEWSFVRLDGECRTASYTTCRFAPGLHLIILRDITERKQAEQMLLQAYTDIEKLKEQLQAENVYLQEEIKLNHNFGEIVGQSDALKYVLFQVERVAPTETTVLLLGETGTGKELMAHAIHQASPRKDRPLVKVNCATLPSSLIESELFGYEKGAFTGAQARRLGRFELANEGSLLLDEIGELPMEVQAKLLRVLQEGEFERLGSSRTIKVNVRVIAATSRNLKTDVQHGLFREDLWYRLSAFPITLPSLSQRTDDIPLLVNHFINIFSKKLGKPIKSITPGAMKEIQDYSWPGNIRELSNVIERAVINAQGPVLHLAEKLELSETLNISTNNGKTLAEMERDIILQRLEETRWRIEGPHGAARSLGMNPSTLRLRMNKHGLQRSKMNH